MSFLTECFRSAGAMRYLALSGVLLLAAGCRSPYHADQGALFGGLGGAGLGALVGSASGHAGAGAAIGAAAGAITGGVVGGALDDIEARNRAQIAAQMGRPAPQGAVTASDVISMSQAGVADELIVNHVNNNGMAHPLQPGDLITLQQNGVSPRVISAMQQPRMVAAAPGPVIREGPPPVIVAPAYAPYWGPPCYYRGYGPGPRVAWGVSVAH